MSILKALQNKVLEIAFLDEGASAGWPIILAHGFPYDIHAYDEVVPRLAQAGARVIVPYLRGFGPTRLLSKGTMRSGQQAALGLDLIDLLDALGVQRAILAGYDWQLKFEKRFGSLPQRVSRVGRAASQKGSGPSALWLHSANLGAALVR